MSSDAYRKNTTHSRQNDGLTESAANDELRETCQHNGVKFGCQRPSAISCPNQRMCFPKYSSKGRRFDPNLDLTQYRYHNYKRNNQPILRGHPLNIDLEAQRGKYIAGINQNGIPQCSNIDGRASFNKHSLEGRTFDPCLDLSQHRYINYNHNDSPILRGRPLNFELEVQREKRIALERTRSAKQKTGELYYDIPLYRGNASPSYHNTNRLSRINRSHSTDNRRSEPKIYSLRRSADDSTQYEQTQPRFNHSTYPFTVPGVSPGYAFQTPRSAQTVNSNNFTARVNHKEPIQGQLSAYNVGPTTPKSFTARKTAEQQHQLQNYSQVENQDTTDWRFLETNQQGPEQFLNISNISETDQDEHFNFTPTMDSTHYPGKKDSSVIGRDLENSLQHISSRRVCDFVQEASNSAHPPLVVSANCQSVAHNFTNNGDTFPIQPYFGTFRDDETSELNIENASCDLNSTIPNLLSANQCHQVLNGTLHGHVAYKTRSMALKSTSESPSHRTEPMLVPVSVSSTQETPTTNIFRDLAQKLITTFVYLSSFVKSQKPLEAPETNSHDENAKVFPQEVYDGKNSLHMDQCNENSFGISPRLHISRGKSVPLPVFDCSKAKHCDRLQFDNSAQDPRQNEIQKNKIKYLVEDRCCLGLIQETIDGLANFNKFSFQISANQPVASAGEDFMTLLEAFYLRIAKEREAFVKAMPKEANEDLIEENIEKQFFNRYPSDLNHSLKGFLLSEMLVQHEPFDGEKTMAFTSDIHKNTTYIPCCGQVMNLVAFIGRTKPVGNEEVVRT